MSSFLSRYWMPAERRTTKVLLAGRAIWLEIAIALSPLGDSSQATSPSSRRANRKRRRSLAQLEMTGL